MKAILVIDNMPQDCCCCPCWRGGNDEFPFDDCTVVQRPLTDEERDNKPEWCPLKPLPTKKKPENPDESWEEMHMRFGWNECLKEIEE